MKETNTTRLEGRGDGRSRREAAEVEEAVLMKEESEKLRDKGRAAGLTLPRGRHPRRARRTERATRHPWRHLQQLTRPGEEEEGTGGTCRGNSMQISFIEDAQQHIRGKIGCEATT